MNKVSNIAQLPNELLYHILERDKTFGETYFKRLEKVSKRFADVIEAIPAPTVHYPTSKVLGMPLHFLDILKNVKKMFEVISPEQLDVMQMYGNLFGIFDVIKKVFGQNSEEHLNFPTFTQSFHPTLWTSEKAIMEFIDNNPHIQQLIVENVLCNDLVALNTLITKLSHLPQLKVLNLSFINLKTNITFTNEMIVRLAESCPQLEELSINASKCEDSGFIALLKMPFLKSLTITNSLISLDTPIDLKEKENESSQLYHLNISKNPFLTSSYAILSFYAPHLCSIKKNELLPYEKITTLEVKHSMKMQEFKLLIDSYPNISSLKVTETIKCESRTELQKCIQKLRKLKHLEILEIGFCKSEFYYRNSIALAEGDDDMVSWLDARPLVTACPRLKELTLHGGDFYITDETFNSLIELPVLEKLTLVDSMINSLLMQIPENTMLKDLSILYDTYLTPNFFNYLHSFPNLETLHISTESPTDYGNDTWLEENNMDTNPLSNIPRLEKLKSLNISSLYDISFHNLNDLPHMNAIEKLSVSEKALWQKDFSGSETETIKYLLAYKNLKYLHIDFFQKVEDEKPIDRSFEEVLELNQMRALTTFKFHIYPDYEFLSEQPSLINQEALKNFLNLKVKKLIFPKNCEIYNKKLHQETQYTENKKLESIVFEGSHGTIDFSLCPNIKELVFSVSPKDFSNLDWMRINRLQSLQRLVFNSPSEKTELFGDDIRLFSTYQLKMQQTKINANAFENVISNQEKKLVLYNPDFVETILCENIEHLEIRSPLFYSDVFDPQINHSLLPPLLSIHFPSVTTLIFEGPVLKLSSTDLVQLRQLPQLKQLIFVTKTKEHIFKGHEIHAFLDNKIHPHVNLSLKIRDFHFEDEGPVKKKRKYYDFDGIY